MIRYLILVVAGLVSAPLMEVGSLVWMDAAPIYLDLTANYFVMVVLPVALLVHFSMALICWKAFEPITPRGAPVYLGTHLAAQAAMLSVLGNPLMDILPFLITLLVSGSLILFVFTRYFWCPRCAGPV